MLPCWFTASWSAAHCINRAATRRAPGHAGGSYCAAAAGLPVPNTTTFAPIGVRL